MTDHFAEAETGQSGVDLVEVARALIAASGQRLSNAQTIVRRLVAGEPPRQVLAEALDRNEAILAELTARWRQAGVRWPLTLVTAITFVAGVLIGRRTAGR